MSVVILSCTKDPASRAIVNFGTDASPWAQHDKLARALFGGGVRQMCECPIEGFTLHGSRHIFVKSHAKTIHTMPVYTMHLIGRISGASQLFLFPVLDCSTHGVSPFFSCKPAANAVPEVSVPLLMRIHLSLYHRCFRYWRISPHGLL